jgi:RNA-directed DNA polymerase
MTPSPTALHRQVDARRQTIARHQQAAHARLMQALTPQIRGWSPYDAPVRSARLVQQLDHTREALLWGWAVPRQPNPSTHRIARQYWRVDDGQGWTLQPPHRRTRLLRQAHTPHRRDVKGPGTRRPYDGDWVYGSTRWGRHPAVQPPVARLLKPQQGRCRACGWPCTEDDPIEVDPIMPTGQGGQETRDNWPRLHRHGHAGQTTQARERRGMDDTHHVAEEPDDANASRPVLKPSRGGDTPA